MLYILTGDFQTGKTRWLQALLADLQQAGVLVNGVIAPGQWVDRGEEASPRFEKLGIDNVLLPQGETLAFARRKDLAVEGEACTQAQGAQLGWAIADAAIDQVNAHFCSLCAKAKDCALPEDFKRQMAIDAPAPERPGLLVIDELGPLELMKNGGLTSAMDVLAQGPTPLSAHALVIVREALAEMAAERFGISWGQARIVRATPEAAAEIKSLF